MPELQLLDQDRDLLRVLQGFAGRIPGLHYQRVLQQPVRQMVYFSLRHGSLNLRLWPTKERRPDDQ
jgi:hypothetical protein